MLDPKNLTAIDDIRFYTGAKQVEVVTAAETDFRAFVEEHVEMRSVIEQITAGEDFYKGALEFVGEDPANDDEMDPAVVHELRLSNSDSPIISLVNYILMEAIVKHASDVHVERFEGYLRVRYRVDGLLRTMLEPPQSLHAPLVARLKVMAGLDITKARVPQDGTIVVTHKGERIHFRLSTLPTSFGEKTVLRMLKKEDALNSVDAIGFLPDDLTRLKRILRAPQGLILVTGPTGSGKTTTVHASLNFINYPEVNIVTLEDPVETSIHGINHVPIHEHGGVGFASGLRSILRQDPDIIFVGEMRDTEVAQVTLRAALTGHLVLSTLHTNSAVESLVRLVDMGIPTYLLSAALRAILSQRLIRRVCKHCAVPYEPPPEELEEFHLTAADIEGGNFLYGEGCSRCLETGYSGRIAVIEALFIDRQLSELIRAGASPTEITDIAKQHGMTLLMKAGLQHVIKGDTTFDELRRSLSWDY